MCKLEADGNFQQPIPSQDEVLKIKAFLVVKVTSKIWASFYTLLNETYYISEIIFIPIYIYIKCAQIGKKNDSITRVEICYMMENVSLL